MINNEDRIAGPYTGNGVQTQYPFGFTTFLNSELVVTRTDTSGNETVLTLTADYTVAFNADQNAAPGGTITLTSALASGFLLTITSEVQRTQKTQLTNLGAWYPEVVETALDKLTILVQQLANLITRSLKIPVSDGEGTVTETPTKTQRANKYLGFDAQGDVTVFESAIGGALVTSFAQTLLDDTTASEALSTLGVSSFAKTVLDDTDAAAARATLSAAKTGANTDITSVTLANAGLKIQDSDASHTLNIVPTANLSANRNLNLALGDADRTLTLSGDATITGSNTGDVAAASQAQMEAGSSSTVMVTPSNFRYHPGAAKAWVCFRANGSPVIEVSYNVSSVILNGTGVYTINFINPFSGNNYVMAGSVLNDGGAYGVYSNAFSASYAVVSTARPGAGFNSNNYVCVVFFGDQ